MTKKVILAAAYSSMEPLAPLHLATVARQEGWEPKIVLGNGPDFLEIMEAIDDYKPDVLGFSIFTGNHNQIFKFIDEAKRGHPRLEVAVGGPHITVFPQKALDHAHYVVPSEGFNGLRRILRGEVTPGIIPLETREPIPSADREDFYNAYPEFRDNPIKSMITQAGCPHSCAHCYNSIHVDTLAHLLSEEQAAKMRAALGQTGRLFPRSVRTVDEVVAEAQDIQRLAPETKMIFIQDDSFGGNRGWLREFADKYEGPQFHIMTRFEFLDPSTSKGKERGELLKKAGCSGVSFAIESADPEIREEVLNRNMSRDNRLMFRTLKYCRELGLGIRTFSMLGIPYGATTEPTDINLEQDLKTLKLNVELREETGLPTIAWASTLVPYAETGIERYSTEHGHFRGEHDQIHKIGFRDESVLHFPSRWVGPTLTADTPNAWLDEARNRTYKRQLKTLMAGFPLFALLPRGHEVARDILETRDLSAPSLYDFALKPEVLQHVPKYEKFEAALKGAKSHDEVAVNDVTRNHLYGHCLYKIKD